MIAGSIGCAVVSVGTDFYNRGRGLGRNTGALAEFI
jgi:hypothetical protein